MVNLSTLAGLRFLWRHPGHSLLALLGVALGVAVVVAVDLATDSAHRAFIQAAEQLNGRATHRLVAGPAGLDENLYVKLRLEQGLRASAPVVEGRLRLGARGLTLLGIDPLAELDFQRFAAGSENGVGDLLSRERAVLLSRSDAQSLGVEPGDSLRVRHQDRTVELSIAGYLAGDPPATGTLITDIAVAQRLLERAGRLDRVDLMLSPRQAEILAASLPESLRLLPADRGRRDMETMTAAFRLNLKAMSLLALLVGAYLIYNTLTFSVLQRRPLLANFRLLGMTRRELALRIMLESALIGLIGALLGLLLGSLAGQGLLRLVVRTINDLYFDLELSRVWFSPLVLLKGVLLGVGVALLAALGPAVEAARVPPGALQQRSLLERKSHRLLPWLAGIGLPLALGGWLLAQWPAGGLLAALAGNFLLLFGYSLSVPAWSLLLLNLALRGLPKRAAWLLPRLALRDLAAGGSRGGVAVAALSMALAAAFSVGAFVESFRVGLGTWIGQTLQSDIYLSSAEPERRALPPEILDRLRDIEGIADLGQGKVRRIETELGRVNLLALTPNSRSYQGFPLWHGTSSDPWPRFEAGEVALVSRPLAHHHNLKPGDSLRLFTRQGVKTVEVGAIYRDYSSDRGRLVLHRKHYAEWWQDPEFYTVGIILAEGRDSASLIRRIGEQLSDLDLALDIQANAEIRARSLAIFDRTMAITEVLRLLVVGVAFIGILSALLALQLENARQQATLRALGLTPRQLFLLILLQTSALGLIAGLLALPPGWLSARILIETINLRAFGWSFAHLTPPGLVLETLLLGLGAALLAGLPPARLGARRQPAKVLREE